MLNDIEILFVFYQVAMEAVTTEEALATVAVTTVVTKAGTKDTIMDTMVTKVKASEDLSSLIKLVINL